MSRFSVEVDGDAVARAQSLYGLSSAQEVVDFALRILSEPMSTE